MESQTVRIIPVSVIGFDAISDYYQGRGLVIKQVLPAFDHTSEAQVVLTGKMVAGKAVRSLGTYRLKDAERFGTGGQVITLSFDKGDCKIHGITASQLGMTSPFKYVIEADQTVDLFVDRGTVRNMGFFGAGKFRIVNGELQSVDSPTPISLVHQN